MRSRGFWSITGIRHELGYKRPESSIVEGECLLSWMNQERGCGWGCSSVDQGHSNPCHRQLRKKGLIWRDRDDSCEWSRILIKTTFGLCFPCDSASTRTVIVRSNRIDFIWYFVHEKTGEQGIQFRQGWIAVLCSSFLWQAWNATSLCCEKSYISRWGAFLQKLIE